MAELQPTARPLTADNEDKALFRKTVRQFAEEKVRPRVREMDRAQQMDRALIDEAFHLGLMAIEVPTDLGGAGASFTTAIIAIEELAAVDPSISVCVDVQNTLVTNALLRWATDEKRRASWSTTPHG